MSTVTRGMQISIPVYIAQLPPALSRRMAEEKGKTKLKTLIKKPWTVTMNENYDIVRSGFVLVEDDTIKEVGQDERRMEALEKEADTILEAEDKILLPGLVNAHSHMFQTFMRGLADDKHLFQWLSEEIWPFSNLMSEEDFYCAGLLACLENLKTGATGVIDQHYIYTSLKNGDKIFEAMETSGIRGTLCRCFANIKYTELFKEKDEVVLGDIRRLHETWAGKDGGRLQLSAGPINSWSVSPELFKATKQLTCELGMNYQIHTSEDEDVVEKTAKMYDGMRNVELFDSLGLLDENTQLVHSVWLNDGELETVKARGSLVVHCPVANMYLASGVARVPEMRKMGISVALATDGPGSNNAQDMLGTLKYTACLHKIHSLNPQILYPQDVLEMAIHGGARAMGMENSLGVIAPGRKADLVLVDWKKPHIAPVHKADSALVYNANGNDVNTVLVNGEIVVKEGKSTKVDELALIDECQQRITFIKNKM